MRILKLTEQKGIASMLMMALVALFAVAIPVSTNLVQKNSENRSHAAVGEVIVPVTCVKSTLGSRKCGPDGKTVLACKMNQGKILYLRTEVCEGSCKQLNNKQAKCVGMSENSKGDGVCGLANGGEITSSSSLSLGDKCKFGTVANEGTVAPACSSNSPNCPNSKRVWECVGKNGGKTAKCSASIVTNTVGPCKKEERGFGKCDVDSKVITVCQLTSFKPVSGSNTEITDDSYNYVKQYCEGGCVESNNHAKCIIAPRPTGNYIEGSIVNTSKFCGSVGAYYDTAPGGDMLCKNGAIASEVNVDPAAKEALVWLWTCTGESGEISSCRAKGANISVTPVTQKIDGKCGVRSNTCLQGRVVASNTTEDNIYIWKCQGMNGGKSVSCKVSRGAN
jgi:hypothetical protein